MNSTGQKIKTPFELIASFLRSSESDFSPDNDFFWMVSQTGYNLFQWQTPTGHPDKATYWLNPNMMLNRWNVINALVGDWHKIAKWQIKTILPNAPTLTAIQIADILIKKMLILPKNEKFQNTIANYIVDGGSIDEIPNLNEKDLERKILQSLALIGMSPDFQKR